MASKESQEKCFSILWKIKNFSCCTQKQGEKIESPTFVVDDLKRTKWKLWLIPKGETDGSWIGFGVRRELDCKGAEKEELKYEIAFTAEDGSDLKSSGIYKPTFCKGQSGWLTRFVKREEVFISRKSLFLPEDTLRVRCRIWKSVGDMTEDVRCTAHTIIGTQMRSFLWNVTFFSTLEFFKKRTNQIKSKEDDSPLISIDLSLSGGLNSEEIISFELSLQDKTIKFSALRLSLVDASGNKEECNQEEIWFNDPTTYARFTFPLTTNQLLEKKGAYLPNDTLSLFWECSFSKGIVLETIEEVQYGDISSEVKMSDAENEQDSYDKAVLSNVLIDNVKSLYDEHFLSDVKLKTSNSVFPAHKFILSAASPVFKAMFSNDLKEKASNCVDIEDLDDDTVRRILVFSYSASVEDLTWETASRLYVAADKYAILILKNMCSSYLKGNLSPSNACDALLLSDLHADEDLKSSVQSYILKNAKEIVNSEEWKLLMETNAKLAAETVCLQYK
ncbi:speckle-type POZ protein-like [Argiope bruennichi]|uniref:speckle-type POZ protein-like n=1 Tax=Argiope bruennichi TaxID=94029 RepID=UPI002493FAB4|nr:speckle-type POZ protein-like [Argiope bruennichi]